MARSSESTRRPVGVIVREAMEATGYSVSGLGKGLEPSKPQQGRRTVQRALKMNGDQGMTPKNARRFAELLGIDASLLVKPLVSEAERARRKAARLRREAAALERRARELEERAQGG